MSSPNDPNRPKFTPENRRILDTKNLGGHTQTLVKADAASTWLCSCNDLFCPFVLEVQEVHANALQSAKLVTGVSRSKFFK